MIRDNELTAAEDGVHNNTLKPCKLTPTLKHIPLGASFQLQPLMGA